VDATADDAVAGIAAHRVIGAKTCAPDNFLRRRTVQLH
jgi:hypothetical protein